MSRAEELLDSLTEEQIATYGINPSEEPHIVIESDKTVTVPDELRHIAVQGEHNIETVTFDCPRYWDSHDLSQMQMRIVYQRPDGQREPHLVENLRVDEVDENTIHFDWTISGNVTAVKGNISFMVCAKLSDSEGNREREWHTRLNQDLVVDEGMDCSGDEIVEQNPDIIEAILLRLDSIESTGGVSDEQIANAVEVYLTEHPVDGSIDEQGVRDIVDEYLAENPPASNPDSGENLDYSNLYTIGKKILAGAYPRIILMGNSITDGYGGTGYNGSQTAALSTNTAGYCWANVFKKYVEGRCNVTVENTGMYGSVAAEQIAQAKTYLTGGELVIWLSGTNNRISSDTFNDYTTNMGQYITDLKSRCADLLIMSCIPAVESNESARYVTSAEICEVLVREAVGATFFLDMRREFIRYCELHELTIDSTMADGLHPNDTGYWIMFRLLCESIGIPLSAFTSYQQDSEWWGNTSETPDTPGAEYTLLVDTGLSETGEAFISWTDGIIPVMQMSDYSEEQQTTRFSSKNLKKIQLGGKGFAAGTLTIGTIDLATLRTSCVVANQIVVDVPASGEIVFESGFPIPANHTLAMGAVSDTARLSYVGSTPPASSSSDIYMYTKGNWISANPPGPTISLVAAFYV